MVIESKPHGSQRFESQILQPCTKGWLSLWTQRNLRLPGSRNRQANVAGKEA